MLTDHTYTMPMRMLLSQGPDADIESLIDYFRLNFSSMEDLIDWKKWLYNVRHDVFIVSNHTFIVNLFKGQEDLTIDSMDPIDVDTSRVSIFAVDDQLSLEYTRRKTIPQFIQYAMRENGQVKALVTMTPYDKAVLKQECEIRNVTFTSDNQDWIWVAKQLDEGFPSTVGFKGETMLLPLWFAFKRHVNIDVLTVENTVTNRTICTLKISPITEANQTKRLVIMDIDYKDISEEGIEQTANMLIQHTSKEMTFVICNSQNLFVGKLFEKMKTMGCNVRITK